jgi:AraC-like DNA-binding protein
LSRIVFASDKLPANLDDQARFSLWRDLYVAQFGSLDFSRPRDRPFSARFDCARLGRVVVLQFEGTITRAGRTAHEVATDAMDDFGLLLNGSRSLMSFFQQGKEAMLGPGTASLINNFGPGELLAPAESAWLGLLVPRSQLLELAPGAEDLVAKPLAGDVVRHLRRYLSILLGPEGIGSDPVLNDHVGTTLIDLVALALGASGDRAQVARTRGQRAARLRTIKADIAKNLGQPDLSVTTIAADQGVSPRYVQLLFDSEGTTFSRFVLWERLVRAHRMLTDPLYDGRTIAAIAFEAGFGDLSYFNRAFRRRYGASPSEVRDGEREKDRRRPMKTG